MRPLRTGRSSERATRLSELAGDKFSRQRIEDGETMAEIGPRTSALSVEDKFGLERSPGPPPPPKTAYLGSEGVAAAFAVPQGTISTISLPMPGAHVVFAGHRTRSSQPMGAGTGFDRREHASRACRTGLSDDFCSTSSSRVTTKGVLFHAVSGQRKCPATGTEFLSERHGGREFKTYYREGREPGSRSPFDDSRAAFELMMSGEATPSQIGGFLMALRVRGETGSTRFPGLRSPPLRAKMLAGEGTRRRRRLSVSAPAATASRLLQRLPPARPSFDWPAPV